MIISPQDSSEYGCIHRNAALHYAALCCELPFFSDSKNSSCDSTSAVQLSTVQCMCECTL